MSTTRVRLGLLVAANGLRNPGLTAKIATTLDHISGGRLVVGLGAGWMEREFSAFGYDFQARAGDRIDRLAEAIGLMRRLFDGEVVSHRGRYYEFDQAVCQPRPYQSKIPILIGGSGPRRTLRLVAEIADMWNTSGDAASAEASVAVLREHCLDLGRDPSEIEMSIYQTVAVRDEPSDALAWFEAQRHAHGIPNARIDALGPPGAVADALLPLYRLGFSESVFIFRSPMDHETIERIGEVRVALDERVAAETFSGHPDSEDRRPGDG
jgi:alkanesulfonate monooxygenase SsuD/methylene tetrahydromethanopterin reductase-like flavin-dependent oxidoreductase (luciferase family)